MIETYMHHMTVLLQLNIPLSTQTFTKGNSLKIVNLRCHWWFYYRENFLKS